MALCGGEYWLMADLSFWALTKKRLLPVPLATAVCASELHTVFADCFSGE